MRFLARSLTSLVLLLVSVLGLTTPASAGYCFGGTLSGSGGSFRVAGGQKITINVSNPSIYGQAVKFYDKNFNNNYKSVYVLPGKVASVSYTKFGNEPVYYYIGWTKSGNVNLTYSVTSAGCYPAPPSCQPGKPCKIPAT